jgi:hypothetical protein
MQINGKLKQRVNVFIENKFGGINYNDKSQPPKNLIPNHKSNLTMEE